MRALASLLVLALTAGGGRAAAAPPPARESLRERLGVSTAERALRQGESEARERALTRLGALGTPRAVELLVRALEANGLAQSARERLIAVRALAPHAGQPRVRETLMRVMTSIGAAAERSDALLGMLRDTAALALARSGDAEAVAALARALRQPGRVAQAARAALVAHPSVDPSALVRAHGAPTLELVRVLSELDDQRAFDALREMIRRGRRELRAEAALALTRLGSFEAVDLARRLAEGPAVPATLTAVAEILALAGDPRAPRLVRALLDRPEARQRALELARHAPGPELERALVAELAGADSGELPALLGGLMRAPSDAACAALEQLARSPERRALAFQALARARGTSARQSLERLMEEPELRRHAARAGLVRALSLDDPPRELDSTLERLLGSAAPAERAVGAFGVAHREPSRAAELVWSADPVIAEAAARAAPFVGASRTAAERLLRERSGRVKAQLALALVEPAARARVPTEVLIGLVEEHGLASPLAAYALAERDGPDLRGRLLDQLASPDPLLRAQTALGLGASEEPSALSLLESAYRFEIEAPVRRAIVRALSRRNEPVRFRTLALARDLDPDPEVRALSRLSSGGPLPIVTRGRASLFASLERADAAARGAAVELPGGLAVPVLADPDGALLALELPEGPLGLRVALLPREDKSPARGSP